MVNKDVVTDKVTLSLHLQCIMLCIHQYHVHILYKPGPALYTADWLSHHNHSENRDKEISDMNINIHMINTAVDIPICMSIEDIKSAINKETELQMLKGYIIRGWPHTKNETEPVVESTGQ